MLKVVARNGEKVLGMGGGALGSESFEASAYAEFWKEASTAVALSRRGKVHLVKSVDLGVLKALHRESSGCGKAGKMPIAVVCKDYETLGGPMLKGIAKTDQGWEMGDGSKVRFFQAVPGPEEGELVAPYELEISSETRADLDRLAMVMKERARAREAEKA